MADLLQVKDSAAGSDGAENGVDQRKVVPILDTAPAETRSLNKRWEVLVPWDHP